MSSLCRILHIYTTSNCCVQSNSPLAMIAFVAPLCSHFVMRTWPLNVALTSFLASNGPVPRRRQARRAADTSEPYLWGATRTDFVQRLKMKYEQTEYYKGFPTQNTVGHLTLPKYTSFTSLALWLFVSSSLFIHKTYKNCAFTSI